MSKSELRTVIFEPGTRRERRRVQKEVERQRKQHNERREVKGEKESSLPLPPIYGAKHGPYASAPGSGGFRSTLRVHQRPHRFNSANLAGVWPYLTGGRRPPVGPVLGINTLSRAEFTFDPWEFYRRGWVGATGILIMGSYRQGKSFLLKRMITLWILFGRQAINTSDSKGEHGRVAEALGGKVIKIGEPGSPNRINPLEGGHAPATMPPDVWAREVHRRRSLVLQQIIELLTKVAMEPQQSAILDECLTMVVKESDNHPTIRKVCDMLREVASGQRIINGIESEKLVAQDLWYSLKRLVSGNLAGMFEDESNIKLDAECPYTVFDTSALASHGDLALAIAQAVTHAWVQSVLSDKHAHRHFALVREEGWRDMNSIAALEAQRLQQKLAGELGIAQILVVHEGGDFDAVGAAGSRERELAQQLAKGFATKISFAQEPGQLVASARALELTNDQIAQITTLQRGQFVYMTKADSIIVDSTVTTTAWENQIFDTDQSMRSREEALGPGNTVAKNSLDQSSANNKGWDFDVQA